MDEFLDTESISDQRPQLKGVVYRSHMNFGSIWLGLNNCHQQFRSFSENHYLSCMCELANYCPHMQELACEQYQFVM